MKLKMKKFILSLTAVTAVLMANAQISFGVNAGAVFSSFKSKFDGKKQEGEKGKIGFKIGAVANVPLSSGLSFNPELNFVTKGGKTSNTEEESIFGGTIKQENKSTSNFSYLEIPLNVTYTLNSDEESGTGLFFGAGPVLSFGVGGKYDGSSTTTTTFAGSTTTNSGNFDGKVKFDGKKEVDLPASDKDIHYKAFEFGANAFVGYNFTSNINARVMYNIGFSNIDPNEKSEGKNSYLGLTVGYRF